MTQKNLKKIQSFISLESKLEQMNIHRIEVPEKKENLQKKILRTIGQEISKLDENYKLYKSTNQRRSIKAKKKNYKEKYSKGFIIKLR